jgi:hypothetical protein
MSTNAQVYILYIISSSSIIFVSNSDPSAIRKCMAASSLNGLLDGTRSGTQPPRIAMQTIWTAGQINVSQGLIFLQPFDERITLKNQSI